MPITKSARKSLRQNIKRKKRNLAYKKKIKTIVKQIKKLAFEKKVEEAKNLLPQAYKILDKAAKTKIIKKNAAARKKSRLTRSIIIS